MLGKQFSGEDAAALAARFEFSGGQIENIARKAAVFRILHGEASPLAKLIEYCKDEATDNGAKVMGFTRVS
jgi:hypothetical protein